ncbi:MAG: hypothetical protein Ct9H300mP4_10950 [Gammaproteobacteria bacterium]|nr:MAG: hypothetical protein Ct9H300mP4_10950 [Gammaproteobacteria bacterium]
MKIAKEEIFGPVLCAQSFGDNDLETIAQQANDTSYGYQVVFGPRAFL